MKVDKVINNNIVSVLEDGKEIVVMGRGLGFRAKPGSEILETRIEKIFRLDSQTEVDQFKTLLSNLPLEHIQVSTEIINYAKEVLNKKLNQNIYITLTDHINFSIERFHKNMMFANPLLREVRSFYREEYLIGEYAVALIKRKLHVDLPVDEAASVALHIVNAEYNTKMKDTIDITNLIQYVLELVKQRFHMSYDEQSLNYERFITHLRFLSQRIYSNELLEQTNPEFITMISTMYPEEFALSEEIREYINNTYHHDVTDEEAAYLAIHIKRVRG